MGLDIRRHEIIALQRKAAWGPALGPRSVMQQLCLVDGVFEGIYLSVAPAPGSKNYCCASPRLSNSHCRSWYSSCPLVRWYRWCRHYNCPLARSRRAGGRRSRHHSIGKLLYPYWWIGWSPRRPGWLLFGKTGTAERVRHACASITKLVKAVLARLHTKTGNTIAAIGERTGSQFSRSCRLPQPAGWSQTSRRGWSGTASTLIMAVLLSGKPGAKQNCPSSECFPTRRAMPHVPVIARKQRWLFSAVTPFASLAGEKYKAWGLDRFKPAHKSLMTSIL